MISKRNLDYFAYALVLVTLVLAAMGYDKLVTVAFGAAIGWIFGKANETAK